MVYPPVYMFDLGETLVYPKVIPGIRADISAIPGTREALLKLKANNPECSLGVYSPVETDVTISVLERTGLIDIFADDRFIISGTDGYRLGDVFLEKNKKAFTELENYLRHVCRRTFTTYVDDVAENVREAVASNRVFGNVYHLDKKSGLTVPEQKDGYVRIATLDQMKELR